ncbi:MAG: hypothetical protein QXK94_02010 [Candidatus Jordarchaeales archaeon]
MISDVDVGDNMTRLVDIAKKVKEQERLVQQHASQEPLSRDGNMASTNVPSLPSLAVTEKEKVSQSVQVVEKIVYVRKDPRTRLDQNFNVRLPSSFISLLKKKFGERGATVFCRLAILERMKTVFDESELRELGLFQLLEEQYAALSKLKSEGG